MKHLEGAGQIELSEVWEEDESYMHQQSYSQVDTRPSKARVYPSSVILFIASKTEDR